MPGATLANKEIPFLNQFTFFISVPPTVSGIDVVKSDSLRFAIPPQAKSANYQFPGKNWPTLFNAETSRTRECLQTRVGCRLRQ
jgi:hypothetical protein